MKKVEYQETIRVEIDVLRPNGEIETVDVSSKYHRLTETAFARIQEATQKAGRGKAICYRNVTRSSTAIKTKADLMDDSYERIVRAQHKGF